uniref:U10-Theraphotoxin-Ct1b_1 n=1 Tax=Coremiocnemis tropix TaxID=1904443 RepID=A0A482Z686_CORTR
MKVSALTVIAAVMMAVALLAFGDEEINDDTEKPWGHLSVMQWKFSDWKITKRRVGSVRVEGEFCYKLRKCCSGLYCKAFVLHCYRN